MFLKSYYYWGHQLMDRDEGYWGSKSDNGSSERHIPKHWGTTHGKYWSDKNSMKEEREAQPTITVLQTYNAVFNLLAPFILPILF